MSNNVELIYDLFEVGVQIPTFAQLRQKMQFGRHKMPKSRAITQTSAGGHSKRVVENRSTLPA